MPSISLDVENHRPDGEADFARRQLDRDLGIAVLEQPLDFTDRFAGNDNPRHSGGSVRQREFHLRQAVTIGGHGA